MLKGKDFSSAGFLEAGVRVLGWEMIVKGLRWRVGDGRSTDDYVDALIPWMCNFQLFASQPLEVNMVSEYMCLPMERILCP